MPLFALPSAFTAVVIEHLLKISHSNSHVFHNYRPVSYIPLKALKKKIVSHLTDYESRVGHLEMCGLRFFGNISYNNCSDSSPLYNMYCTCCTGSRASGEYS